MMSRRVLVLSAVLALLLATPVLSANTLKPLKPGVVLVGFRGDAIPPNAGETLGRHGGSIAGQLGPLPVLAVRTNDIGRLTTGLRLEYSVSYAYEAGVGKLLGDPYTPNDPEYDQTSSYLLPQRIPHAWGARGAGAGVVVAVIDAGIDLGHREFEGRLVPNAQGGYGYNLVPPDFQNHFDDDLFYTEPSGQEIDTKSHGTRTAAVALAAQDNSHSISGVAGAARILPIRITWGPANNQQAHEFLAARAIVLATDEGADVIVTTWDFDNDPADTVNRPALAAAVQYAYSRNVVIVSAAGNAEGANEPMEAPATFPQVISVGAVQLDANGSPSGIASYPNGTTMDFAAPSGVLTFCRQGVSTCDRTGSGTSFTAPQVAGIVAIMLSCNAGLTPAQVEYHLRQGVTDVQTGGAAASGWDGATGWGMVNAETAIQSACGSLL